MANTFRIGNRTGQINLDSRSRTTEYVVKPGTNTSLIESDPGISIGDAHPEDSGIYCTSITQSEVEPRVWVQTCTYETVDLCEINPLTCDPKVSWSTEKEEEVFKVDVNGDDVVNTVGDQFQPLPTRLKSRIVLIVEVNSATFDGATALALDSKVNADSYSGADAGTLLSSIESAVLLNHFAVGDYWNIRVKMTYNPEGWNDQQILNTGMRQKDPDDASKKKNILVNGREVTSPVPLGDDSYPLDIGDALHYVTFDPYETITYGSYF